MADGRPSPCPMLVLYLVLAIFLLTPAVLAFRSEMQIRAFQREAFGHFQKAARKLRVMVWVILVYYVFVLGGSLFIGDLDDTVKWPMPMDGIVIYIRIGAAILGYALLYGVTKELYLVTQPKAGLPLPGATRRE